MADNRSLQLVSYSSSSDSSSNEETPPAIKKYKEKYPAINELLLFCIINYFTSTSRSLELPGAIANMFNEGLIHIISNY